MAKLLAPLLGFGAHGQIAKTVVAYTWNGINCLRAYVVPSDPKTAPQLAQRAIHKTAHDGYKLYFSNEQTKTSWNLYRTTRRIHGTGYTCYMSSALKTLVGGESPWSPYEALNILPDVAQIRFKSIQDGGTVGDRLFYDKYAGSTPEDMIFQGNAKMTPQKRLSFGSLGPFGSTVFLQVKRGHYVSGIYRVEMVL